MTDRPNVLLICVDHWFGTSLGAAGHSDVLTPILDDLARCGTRYANVYSECPVCIPARRTLMTGMTPRSHGNRVFKETEPMPAATTLAQAFRDAGYQAYAAGKLHVYPQRDRIGFDDVVLDEEGRGQYGVTEDYDIFLGDAGFPGTRARTPRRRGARAGAGAHTDELDAAPALRVRHRPEPVPPLRRRIARAGGDHRPACDCRHPRAHRHPRRTRSAHRVLLTPCAALP